MKGIRFLTTRPPGKATRAFTLLELVVVMAIGAILITWAIPSMVELTKNNRVSSQSHELVALLSFAKSVAVRNNASVPVLLNVGESSWESLVEDPNSEDDPAGCGPGVLRCSGNSMVELDSSASTIVFNNRGYVREAEDAWTSETIFLQHEDCSGPRQRRRIDIMPTGQINSCELPCGSTATCSL